MQWREKTWNESLKRCLFLSLFVRCHEDRREKHEMFIFLTEFFFFTKGRPFYIMQTRVDFRFLKIFFVLSWETCGDCWIKSFQISKTYGVYQSLPKTKMQDNQHKMHLAIAYDACATVCHLSSQKMVQKEIVAVCICNFHGAVICIQLHSARAFTRKIRHEHLTTFNVNKRGNFGMSFEDHKRIVKTAFNPFWI